MYVEKICSNPPKTALGTFLLGGGDYQTSHNDLRYTWFLNAQKEERLVQETCVYDLKAQIKNLP